jgi:hypothetical protein
VYSLLALGQHPSAARPPRGGAADLRGARKAVAVARFRRPERAARAGRAPGQLRIAPASQPDERPQRGSQRGRAVCPAAPIAASSHSARSRARYTCRSTRSRRTRATSTAGSVWPGGPRRFRGRASSP